MTTGNGTALLHAPPDERQGIALLAAYLRANGLAEACVSPDGDCVFREVASAERIAELEGVLARLVEMEGPRREGCSCWRCALWAEAGRIAESSNRS